MVRAEGNGIEGRGFGVCGVWSTYRVEIRKRLVRDDAGYTEMEYVLPCEARDDTSLPSSCAPTLCPFRRTGGERGVGSITCVDFKLTVAFISKSGFCKEV